MFGVKFQEGVTKTVSDAAVIERCRNTYGFAVHVLKEKTVREVAKAAPHHAEEEPKLRRTKPAGKSE